MKESDFPVALQRMTGTEPIVDLTDLVVRTLDWDSLTWSFRLKILKKGKNLALKPKLQIENLLDKVVTSLLTSLRGMDHLQGEELFRPEVLNDSMYFYLMDIYFGRLIPEVFEEVHNRLYDILVTQDDEYHEIELEGLSSSELVTDFIKIYSPLLVTKPLM